MRSSLSRLKSMSLVLIVGLALIQRASAVPPEVQDDASFFGSAAVSQANTRILEIKRLYKKDLHVETFLAPPANFKDALKKNSNKTFADWAQSQATNGKIDGIYVLICKAPPHLEVVVDNASLKKAFPAKDRDKLRDLLLTHFKAKTFDDGLAAITSFTRDRLEQNIGQVFPAAIANEVQDRGQFFSPQLVTRTNSEIKEFRNRFKKDIIIETIIAPPADKQKLLATADAQEKNRIFASWLHERAQAAKADGLIVLISREPSRIQVEVSPAMSSKAFTAKDREQLVKMLIGHFQAKEFDKALETTLDFVYDTVDHNLSPAPAAVVSGTIKDDAGLFSPAAVERAKKEIRALASDHRQVLTIETIRQPAPGQVKRVEGLSADARKAFFSDWLKERMQSGKLSGIYIFICKQPANLQIGIGDGTQAKGFTPANRDELFKILNEQFQTKQFDEGLNRGLDYIQMILAKNTPVLAVKDEAGFFTPEALEKANAVIGDIRRRYQKEVLVESFKEVPSSRASGNDLSDAEVRGKLFAAWAEERRRTLQQDGLAILICKDPMNLQVATAANGILAEERGEVTKRLLARFQDKQYDAGLIESLQFIEQELQKKLLSKADKSDPEAKLAKVEQQADSKGPSEAAPPPIANKKGISPPSTEKVSERVGFDVMWVIWGFAIVGGLWLVIGILRALFGAGRRTPPPPPAPPAAASYAISPGSPPPYGSVSTPQRPYPQQHQPYPPQYPYPGPQQAPPAQGGGGFLPGLMGGLFGAAAGNWMYDRFRGGSNVHMGSTSSPPPVTYTPPPSSPAGYKPPSADTPAGGYSSSGGDFGDPATADPGYSSAGGDFGQPAPTDYASSGGDFGQPAPPPVDYASTGGDFAAPAEDVAGGDFGAPEGPASYEVAGGDDFAPPPEPSNDWGTENTAGGDFGGGSSDSLGGSNESET